MTAGLLQHLPELALPHIPPGGYHLWLRLPDGTDEQALVSRRCAQASPSPPAVPISAPNPPRPISGWLSRPSPDRRRSPTAYGGCVPPATRC